MTTNGQGAGISRIAYHDDSREELEQSALGLDAGELDV